MFWVLIYAPNKNPLFELRPRNRKQRYPTWRLLDAYYTYTMTEGSQYDYLFKVRS